MPSRELMKAIRVELRAPLEAILSQPGIRVACAGCGEEIMNEREVALGGRTLCRGCAAERYVRDAGGVPSTALVRAPRLHSRIDC